MGGTGTRIGVVLMTSPAVLCCSSSFFCVSLAGALSPVTVCVCVVGWSKRSVVLCFDFEYWCAVVYIGMCVWRVEREWLGKG